MERPNHEPLRGTCKRRRRQSSRLRRQAGILGSWSLQRAAAIGAEGLLLGSVELHRHQLDVVRRISGRPYQEVSPR